LDGGDRCRTSPPRLATQGAGSNPCGARRSLPRRPPPRLPPRAPRARRRRVVPGRAPSPRGAGGGSGSCAAPQDKTVSAHEHYVPAVPCRPQRRCSLGTPAAKAAPAPSVLGTPSLFGSHSQGARGPAGDERMVQMRGYRPSLLTRKRGAQAPPRTRATAAEVRGGQRAWTTAAPRLTHLRRRPASRPPRMGHPPSAVHSLDCQAGHAGGA